MSTPKTPSPPRIEALMVRAADGLATPAEHEELMAHLIHHPELRAELEAHRAVAELTEGWADRLALDLALDTHRQAGLSVWEKGVGLVLFLGGLALILGWALPPLLTDETVPAPIRLGLAAVFGGLFVLFAGAVRWRLKTRKSDRYSEVIR